MNFKINKILNVTGFFLVIYSVLLYQNSFTRGEIGLLKADLHSFKGNSSSAEQWLDAYKREMFNQFIDTLGILGGLSLIFLLKKDENP